MICDIINILLDLLQLSNTKRVVIMSLLANRLKNISPSVTVSINALATEMRERGEDVISLAAGEPDFNTPSHIREKAIELIKDGNKIKYTPVPGIMALRNAIAEHFNKRYNTTYTQESVTTGVGGKGVLFNILYATLNVGDEVIIPAPYWVSYPEMVKMAQGTPVIIDTSEDNEFMMTAEELEKAISPKTKWIIFNSPSNPTGAVYTEQALKDIAEVLKKYPHVHILSDDVYEFLVYEGEFKNLLSVDSSLLERMVMCSAVSKTFAMTGWRLGYAITSNQELIKAINKIQSQLCSHTSTVSQYASLEALTSPFDFLDEFKEGYKRRRDLVLARLDKIDLLSARKPKGAFYVYINISKVIGKTTPQGKVLNTDVEICEYLLQEGKVALVPGTAFGLAPYMRLSYATADETLNKALDNVSHALDLLK